MHMIFYHVSFSTCINADINECETNNTCGEYADCHDTDGSYWCECWTGFLGDGYNCTGADKSQACLISYIATCFAFVAILLHRY